MFRQICNDRTLDTTQNLHDCLYQLYHLQSMHPISRLEFWIDAICINQNDLNERAQQVNMMYNIYHQAEEVVVWLGRHDESTHLAHTVIERLGSEWSDEGLRLHRWAADATRTDGLGEYFLDVLKMGITRPDRGATFDSAFWSLHTRECWNSVLEFFSRSKSPSSARQASSKKKKRKKEKETLS